MEDIFENCDSKKYYNKFKILEDSYEQIVNEIPPFDINKITIHREFNHWINDSINDNDNEQGKEFLEKINNNKEWIYAWDVNKKLFNFPLMYKDNVIGIADILFPVTIKLLKEIGGIRIAGLSMILPGGSLIPHRDDTGPSFNSMALNFCLTGDNSRLYVKRRNGKQETYIHKNGKLVIFNSELEHYADNNGIENRVILYIDFAL